MNFINNNLPFTFTDYCETSDYPNENSDSHKFSSNSMNDLNLLKSSRSLHTNMNYLNIDNRINTELAISTSLFDIKSLISAQNLAASPNKAASKFATSSSLIDLNVPAISNNKKLFVGNLPPNTKLQDLIELFGIYGTINEQLSVVKEENYAFIHFHSSMAAQQALNELNNKLFRDRHIRVQYSTSQAYTHNNKLSQQARNIEKKKQLKQIMSNANNAFSTTYSSTYNLLPYNNDTFGSFNYRHSSTSSSTTRPIIGRKLTNSESCFNLNDTRHEPTPKASNGLLIEAFRLAKNTTENVSSTQSTMNYNNNITKEDNLDLLQMELYLKMIQNQVPTKDETQPSLCLLTRSLTFAESTNQHF